MQRTPPSGNSLDQTPAVTQTTFASGPNGPPQSPYAALLPYTPNLSDESHTLARHIPSSAPRTNISACKRQSLARKSMNAARSKNRASCQ